MANLKQATKPPANLKNMKPISFGSGAPAILNPLPPQHLEMTALGTTSIGPIPAILGTTYDTIRQWIRPSNNPQYRIFPVPVKASLQANAVANSAAETASATGSAQLSSETVKLINQALPGTGFGTTVIPATLNSVADSTTRYAQTGSGLSYRATTDPLTAVDAGSSATIDIASFTMQTSSKGDIAISSGSVALLSYSTLYFIFYDDSSLAGGAVTFHASTTKSDALDGDGRFFVGSIVTPAATAPNTSGNNDSGVGAQSGSTYVFLFGSAVGNNGGGAGSTVTNPNNAIDGNFTTFASLNQDNTIGGIVTSLTLSGAAPSSAPWTSLTLNVLSSVIFDNTIASGDAEVTVAYSLDGGVSFTNLYTSTSANRALTTDSVALPVSQNLALVQILCEINSISGAGKLGSTQKVYEAWVIGLL